MQPTEVDLGFLLVISGFSGSGKDAVMDKLVTEGWERIVTYSAGRDPRPGEVDGVHHHFVTTERFAEMISEGEFLEWVEYAETKKGTRKSEIWEKMSAGKKIIWRIDPTAAARVGKIFSDNFGGEAEKILRRTTVVFLRTESPETVISRSKVRNRKEKMAIIKDRINRDEQMWEQLKDRFEHVVINKQGAIAETVETIKAIVASRQ